MQPHAAENKSTASSSRTAPTEDRREHPFGERFWAVTCPSVYASMAAVFLLVARAQWQVYVMIPVIALPAAANYFALRALKQSAPVFPHAFINILAVAAAIVGACICMPYAIALFAATQPLGQAWLVAPLLSEFATLLVTIDIGLKLLDRVAPKPEKSQRMNSDKQNSCNSLTRSYVPRGTNGAGSGALFMSFIWPATCALLGLLLLMLLRTDDWYFYLLGTSFCVAPLANYVALRSLGGTDTPTPGVVALNAFAMVAASAWALLWLPLMFTPFAVIAFIFCTAPFLALFHAMRICIELNERITPLVRSKVEAAGVVGLLVGVIALYGPQLSFLTHNSLVNAAVYSELPEQRRAAIRALRTFGQAPQLVRGSYGMLRNVLPLETKVRPAYKADYRDVYYRVTGSPFNTAPLPLGYDNATGTVTVDSEIAGTAVGGKSSAVYLAHAPKCVATLDGQRKFETIDIHLSFANRSEANQEARAQIKLPPGGVVSNAALYIAGHWRPASIAERNTARKAYRDAVIVQRRDPLLISYHGPDRVLVQCFPVPAQSVGHTIEIKFQVTAPVADATDAETKLIYPRIVEANFDYKNPFFSANQKQQEQVWAAQLRNDLQKFARNIDARTRLFVVIDGGAKLRLHSKQLADALGVLAQRQSEPRVYFASDEISSLTKGKASMRDTIKAIANAPYVGGPDNSDALQDALTAAGKEPSAAVVWLHGPQPMSLYRLASKNSSEVPIFEAEIEPGPFNCTPAFEKLSLSALNEIATNQQTVAKDVPPCLLARKQTLELLGTAHDSEACAVAAQAGIVSPATSAIVLESYSQYQNAGIEAPADVDRSSSAPPSNSNPTIIAADMDESSSSNALAASSATLRQTFAEISNQVTGQLNQLNSYSAVPTAAAPVQQFNEESPRNPLQQSFSTVVSQLNRLNVYHGSTSGSSGTVYQINEMHEYHPESDSAQSTAPSPAAIEPWQVLLLVIAFFALAIVANNANKRSATN